MHLRIILAGLGLTAPVALAALNEPCQANNGAAGVCITASDCKSSGGSTVDGACPRDPANVKCCTKPSCANGPSGNCRWSSDCAGSTASNQCPGPAAMKCCSSAAPGFGGYAQPKLPPASSCKKVAIDGARTVIAEFPGLVRELFCIRDCACGAAGGSDHCCGLAIDFMLSDAGGAPTLAGREAGEWIMNNADELKLKYVIWGQRIWTPGKDKVGPWTGWRTQEDRGDVTANHWDHVHASFQG